LQPSEGKSVSSEEVQAFLRARIANYKVPRVVTFHEALPREDSGKIFKRLLRAPYWSQAGRRI
jgi:long-chain acyl-CoA synthetase